MTGVRTPASTYVCEFIMFTISSIYKKKIDGYCEEKIVDRKSIIWIVNIFVWKFFFVNRMKFIVTRITFFVFVLNKPKCNY